MKPGAKAGDWKPVYKTECKTKDGDAYYDWNIIVTDTDTLAGSDENCEVLV